MNDKIEQPMGDGGPAFPAGHEAIVRGTMGMSIRDYFAGQAMSQGMAVLVSSSHNLNATQINQLARTAYLASDAMLKARQS